MRPIPRRLFLQYCLFGLGVPFLPGCSSPTPKPSIFDIPGDTIGEPSGIGHLVRQPLAETLIPPPTEKRHTAIIIGGGVSGVSAGWKLARSGVTDFVILDIGDRLGWHLNFRQRRSKRYRIPLGSALHQYTADGGGLYPRGA